MIKLKTGQIVKLRNNMLFIAVNVKGKLILVNEDGLYDEGHDSDLKCPNDKQWDVVSVYYSPLGISFDCIEKPLLLIKNRGLIVDGNYKLECWYSTDLEQKVTTLEWQIFEDMVVKYYETGKWWIDDDIDKYMKTDKPEFKDDKIRIPEGYYGLGSIYALREKLEKRLLNEKIHKDIEALRKLVKAHLQKII
jgi:hypothetical protein